MKALTDRQHEVLDFICMFSIEKGYPPTNREIGAHFDFSYKAADDFVKVLVRKGYISQENNSPRSIKILKLASIYHGKVGGLFLQVAPRGTINRSECAIAEAMRLFDEGHAGVGLRGMAQLKSGGR